MVIFTSVALQVVSTELKFFTSVSVFTQHPPQEMMVIVDFCSEWLSIINKPKNFKKNQFRGLYFERNSIHCVPKQKT